MLTLVSTLLSLFVQCTAPPSTPELIEMLPGIRVAQGIVEFDATIAINAHHPDTPDVYLEMFVTAPDSREHESLVLARIKPSNLHAALLAAGFDNGDPHTIDAEGNPKPAHGDSVRLLVANTSGDDAAPRFIPLTSWAVHIDTGRAITDDPCWEGFVFAGSKITARGYEADGTGTLVSLTTFSNEVIAPKWSVSHLAEVDEPVWIANRELLPEKGDQVIVRIVANDAKPLHQPDGIDIDRDP